MPERIRPTYEVFSHQFLVEKKTIEELSDFYKVSMSTINRWMNIFEIKTPTKIKDLHRIPESEFREIVKNSFSIRECLLKCNLVSAGGGYTVFNNRVKKLEIDISHFCSHPPRKYKQVSRTNINDILIENSSYTNTSRLKKRLISSNLLEEKCQICGLINEWNEKSISLQLDHINGVSSDNRLENLRILCPNCHSQTETFCRRKSSLLKKK